MERDLIGERTLDGLAAAEAQGRKGGRPPALDRDTLAVAVARRGRGESVTAIAAHLKIGRSTLYRALHPDQSPDPTAPEPTAPAEARDGAVAASGVAARTTVADRWRPVRARIRQPDEPVSARDLQLRDRLVRQREAMRAVACPTCGHEPLDAPARGRQRQDLAMTWLYPDPASELRLLERVHCVSCQPHQRVAAVACVACADGPLLAGDLADHATHDLPPAVRRWLTDRGWQLRPRLLCPNHPHSPPGSDPDPGSGQSSSSRGSSGASGSRSGRRPPPGAGR